MAIAVWALLASLALLLQPKLSLFDYPLNLTLALVYAFGMRTAFQQPGAFGFADVTAEIRSTVFGACIGAIEDAMSGSLIGPSLLSKGLAGFISSIMYRDIFFRWESVIGGVVLFFITFLDGIVVIAARQLFSNMAIGGHAAVDLVIMQAIMNIPLGLMLRPGQKASAPVSVWSQGRR